MISEWKLTNYWTTQFFSHLIKKKAGEEFCYFIKPVWFIYWKCMICHSCLPHCCLSRWVLIQHQVKCLWKLNCFGFICWSCQFLALLYPTQCCLYLYHWCFLIEFLSSLKYGFKKIGKCLKAKNNLICMWAQAWMPVGCFCSHLSYFHTLFFFMLKVLSIVRSNLKWLFFP